MIAREAAYKRQMLAHESGVSPSPVVGLMQMIPEPAAKTLQSEDPSVIARRAAYLARKEEKKKKRATLEPKGFLSKIAEMEVDVQYRFSLFVLGEEAERLVESACNCRAASLYKERGSKLDEEAAAEADGEEMGGSRRLSKSLCESMRCLCVVENPLIGTGSGEKRFAKLILRAQGVEQDVPRCSNRLEALSSTVVFLLRVSQPDFEDQLASMESAVERMRQASVAKLRPVRAVVLCQDERSGAASSTRDPAQGPRTEDWARQLSEYEVRNGELWKFGPLDASEGSELHRVFADIASVRIAENHLGEGKEHDEVDDGSTLVPGTLNSLEEEPNVLDTRSPRNSECSEGFQRPPVFDTEIDGSVVSENTLEHHQALFGDRMGTYEISESEATVEATASGIALSGLISPSQPLEGAASAAPALAT